MAGDELEASSRTMRLLESALSDGNGVSIGGGGDDGQVCPRPPRLLSNSKRVWVVAIQTMTMHACKHIKELVSADMRHGHMICNNYVAERARGRRRRGGAVAQRS